MRIFQSQTGIVIKVGQNAQENDELVKSENQNYLWCHLDNQPSPHAVIQSSDPDTASINLALQLVKFYSKAKNARQAKLIMTPIQNLHRVVPKRHPGLVTLKRPPTKKTITTNYSDLNKLESFRNSL